MDPILTRAAKPFGLPQAPLIPVYKRSEILKKNILINKKPAPAHESILLILSV